MTDSAFPIERLYELGRLSQAGDEVVIAPSHDDLKRIAEWAGVDAVESLRAKVELRKLSPTRFSFDAELAADIVQACVVTLEPVRTHIERTVKRELFLSPAAQHAAPKGAEIEVAPVDEDGREEIASLRYDLAVPLLEELSLAIDPYPRAPGVTFEPPPDAAEAPVHPFEALKRLKTPR